MCAVSQLVSQLLFMLGDSLFVMTSSAGLVLSLQGLRRVQLADEMVLFDPS